MRAPVLAFAWASYLGQSKPDPGAIGMAAVLAHHSVRLQSQSSQEPSWWPAYSGAAAYLHCISCTAAQNAAEPGDEPMSVCGPEEKALAHHADTQQESEGPLSPTSPVSDVDSDFEPDAESDGQEETYTVPKLDRSCSETSGSDTGLDIEGQAEPPAADVKYKYPPSINGLKKPGLVRGYWKNHNRYQVMPFNKVRPKCSAWPSCLKLC